MYLFPVVCKRLFDIGVALLLLGLSSPLFILVASVIRLQMGNPILFRQMRPGLGGKPFPLFKFRTMIVSTEENSGIANDGARLTALGRFLRRTSLDELPELWNILKGDMSFVGPRPLLMQYLDRYTAVQARRHEVMPGLTGWAQIHGRNTQSWEKRLELDVWYVDHRSFFLDLQILLKTGFIVIFGTGVSAEGYATMPEFGKEKP